MYILTLRIYYVENLIKKFFIYPISDGQRSPPPSMVYGQASTPMMSSTMMYMSQYINPYLQVIQN